MSSRVLPASDAHWRPSNQMGVQNTDLAKQLQAATLAARMWRLWLVVGTPPELANTLQMKPEQLEWAYPDGPRALPPELA
ncbi:MAG: hypothetical protein WKF48_02930 [Solirubrobacteraceae bacterium]